MPAASARTETRSQRPPRVISAFASETGEMRTECIRIDETDKAERAALAAVRAEECGGGRPVDAETAEQSLICLAARGHVRLEQHVAGEVLLDLGQGECVLLHFLARDAPVRVEVQHCGLAGRPRGFELTIEFLDR